MIRISAVAMLYWVATAAFAQFGNPGGMSPDTPRMDTANPPADHANTQDKLFVRQLAIGGQAEVELGKLAQQKGASNATKEFGKRMVQDHDKANAQLMKAARNIRAEVPKDVDPEHKRVRSELEKVSGAEFDAAYFAAQIRHHQKTANLLMWEISFGQNEALKKYASDTLPTVLEHLDTAKQYHAELLAAPPPR